MCTFYFEFKHVPKNKVNKFILWQKTMYSNILGGTLKKSRYCVLYVSRIEI